VKEPGKRDILFIGGTKGFPAGSGVFKGGEGGCPSEEDFQPLVQFTGKRWKDSQGSDGGGGSRENRDISHLVQGSGKEEGGDVGRAGGIGVGRGVV